MNPLLWPLAVIGWTLTVLTLVTYLLSIFLLLCILVLAWFIFRNRRKILWHQIRRWTHPQPVSPLAAAFLDILSVFIWNLEHLHDQVYRSLKTTPTNEF